jgi:hypothetical protein
MLKPALQDIPLKSPPFHTHKHTPAKTRRKHPSPNLWFGWWRLARGVLRLFWESEGGGRIVREAGNEEGKEEGE